jgi:hypothetical protein
LDDAASNTCEALPGAAGTPSPPLRAAASACTIRCAAATASSTPPHFHD